jgi:putative spermidine/putrescine transport system substrate-binding protein
VPWYLWLGGISWITERYPEGKHPTDFKELWDVEKFPGRRTFRARPFEMLEMALVADGVPPKEVYPLDVERAFKACDRIKPHVPKFAKATPQTIELLRNNEVDFSYTYSGRALSAKDEGVPIDFSFKQVLIGTEFLTVLKGSKHKTSAMKYINFCLRPDRQVHFAKIYYYSPTKAEGLKMVPNEIKKYFPDPKDPANVVLDHAWWRDRYTELHERFKEWMME